MTAVPPTAGKSFGTMWNGPQCILVLALVQICSGRSPILQFDFSGCPPACPATFEPICGSDGITYDNECELELADCIKPPIRKLYDGYCGGPLSRTCPTTCPATLKPVCGSDGVTYDNECELEIAICENRRIHKLSEGACEGANSISCSGKCPQLHKPVCGSDNITYNNECELDLASCKKSSIYKLADGECDPSGKACLYDCAELFQPVCGSDGVVYDNDCRLRQAACKNSSIFKVSDGECGPQECTYLCNDSYEPVCGSDGLTYKNQCELDYSNCKDASLTKIFDGECGEVTTESSEEPATLSLLSEEEVITEAPEEPIVLSFLSKAEVNTESSEESSEEPTTTSYFSDDEATTASYEESTTLSTN